MLRACNAAFNVSRMNPDDSVAGDAYKASRYELRKSIRDAKRQYRLKLELMFDNSDSQSMWQGLQTTTDYKGKSSCVVPTEVSLSDKIKTFCAHFEKLSKE
jgi:hypothetical protein